MDQNELNNALLDAAKSGNLTACQNLLAQGADTAARYKDPTINYDEFTALHWAARYGHTDICRLLIERGADIMALDKGQNTPLHEAAFWGSEPICRMLVSHGAEIHAKAVNDVTPLYEAILQGNTQIVHYFLRECTKGICQPASTDPIVEGDAQVDVRAELIQFLSQWMRTDLAEHLVTQCSEQEMVNCVTVCRLSQATEEALSEALPDEGAPTTPARSRSFSPL